MMARLSFFPLLLLLAPSVIAYPSHLRATQAAAAAPAAAPAATNTTLPTNTAGLVASAAFVGFNVTVPAGTVLNLTFTPTFGPSTLKAPRQFDGVVVAVVFSDAGRAKIAKSTCGKYDEATQVFRGKTKCVRSIVTDEIEKTPRPFVAAANVTTVVGPPFFVSAAGSGSPVSFGAVTDVESKGFYFSVVSSASSPVTLTGIKVTGQDLKTMTAVPDIAFETAVPATAT